MTLESCSHTKSIGGRRFSAGFAVAVAVAVAARADPFEELAAAAVAKKPWSGDCTMDIDRRDVPDRSR